jgi:hypothetical protein
VLSGIQLGDGFEASAYSIEQSFCGIRDGYLPGPAAETLAERGVVTDRLDETERTSVLAGEFPGRSRPAA